MTDSTPMRVTAVVGNPKPGSRTLTAARECARQIADAIGTSAVESFDLAELGPRLLEWNDSDVAIVREAMRTSTVLVIASPTYKATYTGVLKLLFDQIAADELLGTIAVPLMVGGSPTHSLAVETHLRPLLVEVGCSCPTEGLYVVEAQLPDIADVIGTWLAKWRHVLPVRYRSSEE
jgi:FMN reductase